MPVRTTKLTRKKSWGVGNQRLDLPMQREQLAQVALSEWHLVQQKVSPWSFNLFDALRFQVQVHPSLIGLRDNVAHYELSLQSSHDTETINLHHLAGKCKVLSAMPRSFGERFWHSLPPSSWKQEHIKVHNYDGGSNVAEQWAAFAHLNFFGSVAWHHQRLGLLESARPLLAEVRMVTGQCAVVSHSGFQWEFVRMVFDRCCNFQASVLRFRVADGLPLGGLGRTAPTGLMRTCWR